VRNTTGFYPRVQVDTAGAGVVSHAGGLLLTETVRTIGLDRLLSTALQRWCKPLAAHHPGKIVCDLAVSLALGGDCLADVGLLRAEPGVYGPVASDPTISRAVDALAADAPAALAAINTARAAARARVWALAGEHAPDHDIDADHPLIVDVDATLVTAHSDKQGAAPTFKRGFGFHPLWAFIDHGDDGTGEPLTVLLRPGNAGSNTAADHITVVRQALAQLPGYRPGRRPGRRVLIRTDTAGATHDFLDWVHNRRLSYSVGFRLPGEFAEVLPLIPKQAWTPAINADGDPRDGAWVAEVTDLLDLKGWPEGMRVIVRKERPHPRCPASADRPRRDESHRVRHQHPPRPTRRPRTTAPPPRQSRRPHPLCQTHRPDQPAAAPVQPEPDLVRPRRGGSRTHRLDADARPGRGSGPQVGTQTAPPPAVHRRRPTRPHRPPPHPPPGPTPPLGRPRRLCRHPATPARTRLTRDQPVPTTPAPSPASGIGAHPRRHPGHRHTQLPQSTQTADHTGQTITPDRPTKDPG
jgi:hypothetical protein